MEFITGILLGLGGLTSLVLEYSPWVKTRWEKLSSQAKRLISVGLMVVVTLGVYALSCFTTVSAWACPDPDVLSFIGNLVLAIVSNQGVHRATKRQSNPLGY